MQYFNFIISVLAVWRITHLISKEDGPFDIIFIVRKKAGNSFFGHLMDCFYCLSIWVALPFGIWLGTGIIPSLVIWFALSGAACLLEKMTSEKEKKEQPVQYFEEEEINREETG